MVARTRELFVAALATVILLALLSDPTPLASAGFESMGVQDEPTEITCRVIEVEERTNGWTLTLEDEHGVQAQAYCAKDLSQEPPVASDLVQVRLRPSDRKGFFFIEAIEAITLTN